MTANAAAKRTNRLVIDPPLGFLVLVFALDEAIQPLAGLALASFATVIETTGG
jgi:hypothetical protein